MKDFNTTEKVILISFIFISIFILWLVSPMGRIFLPVDKTNLEESLSFKIPERMELKQFSTEEFGQLFHLTSNNHPAQITTIIIEKDKPIEEASDRKFSSKKTEAINTFFKESGLSDTKIFDCKEEKVITCKFKATKDELNDITHKEGEVIFLTKKGKPVTILSVAPIMSYDAKVLNILLEKIIK